MERWHVPFLGIEEIPRSLTEFEIAYFFTYTETELAALNSRKTALLKVAAAIQLGFLRLSGGTLLRLKSVPKKVLDHIGQQLAVAAPSLASLRTLYQRRERTQWDHQSWAIQTAGFQTLIDRQRRVLVTRLNQQANMAGSVDEIVTYAGEWCYEHQIIARATAPSAIWRVKRSPIPIKASMNWCAKKSLNWSERVGSPNYRNCVSATVFPR